MDRDIHFELSALNEVLTSYKSDITPFEAEVWKRIILRSSREQFLAFLERHMRTSVFAPKPSDAERAFHPSGQNIEVAFERLRQLVESFGPYRVPEINEPAMVGAIAALGGWVKVNEEMPARTESYLIKDYKDRFSAVYTFSETSQALRGLPPPAHALAIAIQKPMTPSVFEPKADVALLSTDDMPTSAPGRGG